MFTILTAVPLQTNTWFHSPGSVLLELGPLTIRYYGLMITIGFLSALFVMKRLANRDTADELDNFAIVGLMLGLVGARLWFVFLNLHYYMGHPEEIHQIWLGGQSIQGGLIGGVLGTWLYDCVLRKESFANYIDKLSLIAVVLPLAQAIGRWGNFFNEEAYGGITTLPWGLYISHTGHLHHPTFLYESLGNLVIFALMLRAYDQRSGSSPSPQHESKLSCFRLRSNKLLNSSQVIGLYLILYSSLRLVIENLRTDSLMLGGMPAAALLSWGAIVIGVILIIAGRRKA